MAGIPLARTEEADMAPTRKRKTDAAETAVEAETTAPMEPAPAPDTRPTTKLAQMLARLQGEDGATIAELAEATGWQAHTVRGALSGVIAKKLGHTVISEKVEGRGRVYRVGVPLG
jgi:Protein of unknown function (DUF3489)